MIKSVKHLVTMLKAINIKSVCTVFIHEDGMTFTVEQPRIVKAIAYIKSHLFFVYNIKEEICFSAFGLPLEAFIECLRLAIPATTSASAINAVDTNFDYCEITYNGMGSVLGLRRSVKEHSQKSVCELMPFEPEDEGADLTFSGEAQGQPQKIILKTNWLKRVIDDFSNTTEHIFLTVSPGETSMSIVAEGPEKTDEAELLQNADEFTSFNVDHEVKFSYIYQHIMYAKKTIGISSEVSIDIYDDGALRMVFKIASMNHQPIGAEDYIEYSFLPSTSFS